MASTRNSFFASVLCWLVIVVSACQDMLPANPYDPHAPTHQQAKGEIKGQILLDDPAASPDTILQELDAITVRLTAIDGEELVAVSCASETTTEVAMECRYGERTASFAYRDLQAGNYRVLIDGVDPRYLPVTLQAISLVPGEIRDLATLRYVVFDPGANTASHTGQIEGTVKLISGQGATRRVTLYRKSSTGLEVHGVQQTDSDGSFVFEQLAPGTYGVGAEADSYTPDYRAGAEITHGLPVEQNTVSFHDGRALALYPVSTVLIPAVQQIFGRFYTSGETVPLQVLQFGGMDQMRLSADDSFDNDQQAWQDYAASAEVEMPAEQGTIALYAQFQNRTVASFVFASPVYQVEVIRDATAPVVESVVVRGETFDLDDGRIWLSNEAAQLSLDIDASDQHSAVYEVALYHDDQNSLGDPATLSYTLLDAPPGLIRIAEPVGLTAGEGEKKIFVYLRDRAVNTSAAGEATVWVDTTPPTVDALAVGDNSGVTGTPIISVTLQASDLNRVVSVQLWEEGGTIPAPRDYRESLFVHLAALDYANTSRQINVLVYDQAGNVSTLRSETILFDDRSSLWGLVNIEDAADGSPGDPAGVVALVNGQSFPFTATTSGRPNEFSFAVSEVAAGSNRTLVLQKAGYADASAGGPYTLLPGVATNVGLLQLRLARGTIEGYAQLDGELDHSGIVVTVQSTGQIAMTNAVGFFRIENVTAGLGYSLILRRDDNHSVETVSGIDVPASGTVAVSTSTLPIVLVPLAGSFSIQEGAYTNDQNVTLLLTYDGAIEYRSSELSDFSDATWQSFSNAVGSTTGYPFQLSDSDGLHFVWVQFRDPGSTGFTSDSRQDAITLDRQQPTNVSILINGGASYIGDVAVELTLSGVDNNAIAQYQLAHVDTSDPGQVPEGDWAAAKPYPGGPFGVVLPGSVELRTVRVWVRLLDVAGNISLPALAEVQLDPYAPVSGSISINGGAPQTNSFTVTLDLQASDDSPIEMRLGDNAVPATGAWEPYVASRVWVVPPAAQGLKTVCVAYRDAAGNRSQDYCDDIDYDSQAPPPPAMTTTAGLYTRTPTAALDLGNVTADVDTIEVSSNAAFSSPSVYAAQAQVDFVLPDPDGTKVVYARYVDAAGNHSAIAALDIVLDRLPPESPAFAFVDGAYTVNSRIELQLSALGADKMLLSATADCSVGTFAPFAVQGFVDVADPDGVKDVSVQFRDQAGNETTCIAAQITLDRLDPVMGTPPLTLSSLQIVLTSDESAVEAAYVRVDFNVSGASEVKVSNLDGAADATWQSYSGIIPSWRLLPGDGDRTVYAFFRDQAGNTSAQQTALITVDSTGDVTGAITLEGSTDYSGLSFTLGSTIAPHSMVANRFTVDNMLTKAYVPLKVSNAGYDDTVLPSGVQVPAGGTVDVGNITLKLSRGSVEGFVELVGRSTHENVLIELLNTGYSTQSNSAGYFLIQDVLAGNYDLVARRDGFSTRTVLGVQVQSGLTTQVSTSGSPLQMPVLVGDFTINGGVSAYTSDPAVTLNLSFTDAVKYRASEDPNLEDGGGTPLPFVDFATANCVFNSPNWDCSFSLANVDDLHTVYVQFEDSNLVQSDILQSTITLDRIPPTVGTVLIDDGATFTRILNANVAVTTTDDNGVPEMQRSVDGINWLTAEPFQSPLVWSYTDPTTGSPNLDDNMCIWVRFIDPAGNRSAPDVASSATDCITLDVQPPTPGAPALVLEDAIGTDLTGGLTTTANIFLAVAATDAVEMMFSNKLNFAGAVWQLYDSGQSHFWTLVPGDGPRTVYVQYRDAAGNTVGAGGGLNAAVTMDSIAPMAPEFSIQEGAFSGNRTINLDFSNNNVSEEVLFASNRALGVVQVAVANNSVSFNLPDVEGLHILTLQYRDSAGNVSASSTASITLDRSPPDLLDLSCLSCGQQGATLYSSSAALSMGISAVGATQMRLTGAVLAPAPAAWQPFSSFVDVTLDVAAGEGNKTVTVELQDDAGNSSLPVSMDLVVYYDDQPPSCNVSLAGFMADGVTAAPADKTAVTSIEVTSSCTGAPTGMAIVPTTQPLSCATAVYSSYSNSTIVVVAAGDGPKNVLACYIDATGNVTLATVSAATPITLDATAPQSASIVIDGGAAYTNAVSPHAVTVTSSVTGALEARLSTDGLFDSETWGNWTGSDTINLPTGEGLRTVWAQFRDELHNTTQVVDDDIFLDFVVPTLTMVTIIGHNKDGTPNTTATASLDVELEIDGSNATWIATGTGTNLDCGTATYDTPFAAIIPFTLTSAGRVWVCLKDNAGNVSSSMSDLITVDTTAPTGCSVTLAGFMADGIIAAPANQTAVTSIQVSSSCSVAPAEMAIVPSSQTLNCASAPYAVFSGTTSVVVTAGDGSKNVRACFRDAVGNYTTSTVSAVTGITLDQTPPQSPSVVINAGAPYATAVSPHTVTLTSGVTGASQARFSTDGLFDSETWKNWTGSDSVDLPTGEGPKTVYAIYRDELQNTTAVVTDDIFLDYTSPNLTSITLIGSHVDGTPDTTATANVLVDVSINGSGATWVATSTGTNLDCGTATYDTPFAPVLPVTVTGAGTLRLCLRDNAGNVAGPALGTITVDTTAPSGCSVTLAGYMADGSQPAPANRTAVTSIRVDSSCSGSPSELAIVPSTQNLDCAMAPYSVFASSTQVDVSGGDGLKNIVACFRDMVGNFTAATVSAVTNIVLDQTPPSSLHLVVARNGQTAPASITSSVAVDVFLTAEGAADAMYARNPSFTAGGGANTGTWLSYPPAQQNLSLVSYIDCATYPNGITRTIYAKFRDNLRNESEVVSYSLLLDRCNPATPTVTLRSSPGAYSGEYVRSYNVAADIGNVANATGMEVRLLSGTTSCLTAGTWQPYDLASSISVNFTNDGVKRVCVRLKDGSDRVSSPGYDNITVDTTAPTAPTMTPSSIIEANFSCARIAPSGVTEANFWKWQARDTGGAWADASLDANGKLQFSLIQDADNIVEIRAMDRAGNFGAPGSSLVQETSSVLLPTNMQVKQVCANGSFVILKSDLWPSGLGFDGSPDNAILWQRADIALVDLDDASFYQFNGDGGILYAASGPLPGVLTNAVDAACSLDSTKVLYTVQIDEGSGVWADAYYGVWDDPIRNPLATLGTSGLIPLTESRTTGGGWGSIDVVRWANSTSLDRNFWALSVTRWDNLNFTGIGTQLKEERIRPVYFVKNNSSSSHLLKYGAMMRTVDVTIDGSLPRYLFGLAIHEVADGTDGSGYPNYLFNTGYMYWDPNQNRWEVKRHTTTNSESQPYSYNSGFGGFDINHPPFGTMIRPASFRHNSGWYVERQFVWVNPGNGEVNSFCVADNTNTLIGTGSWWFTPAFDHASDRLAWLNYQTANQVKISNVGVSTYSNATDILTFRYAADRDQPIVSTTRSGAGEPFVVYSTKGMGSTRGVVIGYRNRSGCAECVDDSQCVGTCVNGACQ